MAKKSNLLAAREAKLRDATEILRSLGFSARQSNEVAGYTFLALLDLRPLQSWNQAAEGAPRDASPLQARLG